MLSLLKQLASKVAYRRRDGGWVVVDFRDEVIRLPSGEVVRKEDIISIDTERKVIVFRDRWGRIREEPYA